MMIKFPTVSGVGMVRGDQRMARECYSASVKQKAVDNVYMDELDMRDEVFTRPEPSEELEPVSLDDDPEHLAYIGSKLAEDLKGLLTQFLRHNKDVFAWKQANMGGIDPTVITHRLNASPSFKLVKQKRRSFAPERQKAINEEVDKLLQVGAIREVEYPEWLANVVLFKKKMASGDSVLTSTTSTKHAQRTAFLFQGSTSSWTPQQAMNSSVLWTPSPATTRSVWTRTTKKRPRSSQRREPIVIV